jgi:hypothetical protein
MNAPLPEPDRAVICHITGGRSHRWCVWELDYLFFDDLIAAALERRAAMDSDWVFVVSTSSERTVEGWVRAILRHFKNATLINPLPSGRIALLTWAASLPAAS